MKKIDHMDSAKPGAQRLGKPDGRYSGRPLPPRKAACSVPPNLHLLWSILFLLLVGMASPSCAQSGESLAAMEGEAVRAIHNQDYGKAIELLKALSIDASSSTRVAESSSPRVRGRDRPLKRFGQAVMLKDDPEIIRKYEDYHATTWPEVLEGVRKAGVRRTFIYRFGRLLFMFMEAHPDFDMETDMPKYMEDPRAKEWDELMRTYQEPLPGVPEGTTWVQMKEVFAWDWRTEKSP